MRSKETKIGTFRGTCVYCAIFIGIISAPCTLYEHVLWARTEFQRIHLSVCLTNGVVVVTANCRSRLWQLCVLQLFTGNTGRGEKTQKNNVVSLPRAKFIRFWPTAVATGPDPGPFAVMRVEVYGAVQGLFCCFLVEERLRSAIASFHLGLQGYCSCPGLLIRVYFRARSAKLD